ncbi:MAG: Tex family protein [Methanobacteriaceae archaeon]
MIIKALSRELNIREGQTESVIKLIDEGNTIPFIARYRKEATGSLDDEILRKFDVRLKYLRNLEEKKEQVLKSISEQEKLTPEIEKAIADATTLVVLEDIYRPYKPKKRTRATVAKEKGLEPLAIAIFEQELKAPVAEIAEKYVSEENEVATVEDAINGAKDIIAEIISDNSEYRALIRKATFGEGNLISKAIDEDKRSEYEMYYDYAEPVSKIATHRVLAINRGEKEKFLRVKVEAPMIDIILYLKRHVLINTSEDNKRTEYNPYTREILEETIADSYKRLIAPATEREIRNYLTEKAEDKSIKVFSKNLEQLLMQGPILGKTVLGWDPGFRTGCKIAVVDKMGKVLATDVVYPTEPQNEIAETSETITKLINTHNIDLIALGNGTASRESERIIVDIIKDTNVKYLIVNEAGASVYSASSLANEEFPDYDVGARSAISIARRLQDPLAELVKIDPKSIGVGQYQHDMNQKKLTESLASIVEKAVNSVGVNANTASRALLEYVSGITKTTAKNIIDSREANGQFKNREELLNIDGLGPKAYEQCAGFIKVFDGDNLLDTTTVHPESYDATIKLLNSVGYSLNDILNNNGQNNSSDLSKFADLDYESLSEELDIGEITLKDIVKELQKPGRDPRDEMPQPVLKSDVLEIEDLEEGMILQGTVRNVVDFGAFVDIGIHQDALVHISQLVADQFVRHPLDIVSVGDIVEVKIIEIDLNKRRAQLSMII